MTQVLKMKGTCITFLAPGCRSKQEVIGRLIRPRAAEKDNEPGSTNTRSFGGRSAAHPRSLRSTQAVAGAPRDRNSRTDWAGRGRTDSCDYHLCLRLLPGSCKISTGCGAVRKGSSSGAVA